MSFSAPMCGKCSHLCLYLCLSLSVSLSLSRARSLSVGCTGLTQQVAHAIDQLVVEFHSRRCVKEHLRGQDALALADNAGSPLSLSIYFGCLFPSICSGCLLSRLRLPRSRVLTLRSCVALSHAHRVGTCLPAHHALTSCSGFASYNPCSFAEVLTSV